MEQFWQKNMVNNQIVQKIINGISYSYDREIDQVLLNQKTINEIGPRNKMHQNVDLCIEITNKCNLYCENCFSATKGNDFEAFAAYSLIDSNLASLSSQFIRICVTGGEPMLHPDIDKIVEFPNVYNDCGFVIFTNGTVKKYLDNSLAKNNWSIAISLHGNKNAHNSYTKSKSHQIVTKRIEGLSNKLNVHMYCVLNDNMSNEDIDWLYSFRSDIGVKILRFLIHRKCYRYVKFTNDKLLAYAKRKLDERSCIITESSKITFVDKNGNIRLTQ